MGKLARSVALAVVIGGCASLLHAAETREADRVTPGVDWEALKLDWPSMGPVERSVWRRLFAGPLGRLKTMDFSDPDGMRPDFPSELCFTATLPGPITPLPLVTRNTTASRLDFMDISRSGICAGGGTQLSGTGLGPDLVYKIHVDVPCDLRVSVDPLISRENPPAEWDVALYIIREPVPSPDDENLFIPCLTPAESCLRSSDGRAIGLPESIEFSASTDEDYYVIVDGNLMSSGGFELSIVETSRAGCVLSRIPRGKLLPD